MKNKEQSHQVSNRGGLTSLCTCPPAAFYLQIAVPWTVRPEPLLRKALKFVPLISHRYKMFSNNTWEFQIAVRRSIRTGVCVMFTYYMFILIICARWQICVIILIITRSLIRCDYFKFNFYWFVFNHPPKIPIKLIAL